MSVAVPPNDADRIQLEPSWKARIGDYLLTEPMRQLSAFLRARRAAGARIYPPGPDIFAAFDACPFDATRVVILGQDPYHGPGQAEGLAFSVAPGVKIPFSTITFRVRDAALLKGLQPGHLFQAGPAHRQQEIDRAAHIVHHRARSRVGQGIQEGFGKRGQGWVGLGVGPIQIGGVTHDAVEVAGKLQRAFEQALVNRRVLG